MRTRRGAAIAACLALSTGLAGVLTAPAVAHEGHEHPENPEFKALIFSETAGFVHDSVPEAKAMWDELGAAGGFEVVQATDSTLFTDRSEERRVGKECPV